MRIHTHVLMILFLFELYDLFIGIFILCQSYGCKKFKFVNSLLKKLSFYSHLASNSREGNGTPLQYSCLENPMGGGAWWAAVHGVVKSHTERLHFHFSLSCIGEGNGNPVQCSCLENPRDGEPGGLLSMGSPRVRHN